MSGGGGECVAQVCRVSCACGRSESVLASSSLSLLCVVRAARVLSAFDLLGRIYPLRARDCRHVTRDSLSK